MKKTYPIVSEQQTEKLGQMLAAQLKPSDRLFLSGDLGAGKTTLARAILRGLGYQGKVKSPTYTLVEAYQLNHSTHLFHFDLYRINTPNELLEIGIDDYLQKDAILLVEWPEKAGDLLPESTLFCQIDLVGDGRSMILQGKSKRAQEVLLSLPETL